MEVEKLTERLNAPVQGTAADGLKLALALLWERRHECLGAVPVLVCHDEVVVECDAEYLCFSMRPRHNWGSVPLHAGKGCPCCKMLGGSLDTGR